MNPTAQLIIVIVTLILKYGPDAYLAIMKAWQHGSPVTLEEIQALALMVPPPESYFPETK